MKKTYNATIDEAVTTGYRVACMIGTVQKQRWMGLIWVPIAFVVFYHIVPRSTEEKVITAVVMSVVVTAALLLSIGPLIKNNIRKTIIKALGTSEPVQAEYELADDALVFRKMGHELRLSWGSVVRFEDSPTTLDVFTQPTGLAMIPKRIFNGDDEIREWTEFIKQHLTQQSPSAYPEGRADAPSGSAEA